MKTKIFDFFCSSVETADLSMFDDDLSASSVFFSVSGSTYRHRVNSPSTTNSDRFRVCVTVPILEHLHEVNQKSFSIHQ
jgi:hypothetical protein